MCCVRIQSHQMIKVARSICKSSGSVKQLNSQPAHLTFVSSVICLEGSLFWKLRIAQFCYMYYFALYIVRIYIL
jgi:hypothetical protein